jgi:hypothetical protein
MGFLRGRDERAAAMDRSTRVLADYVSASASCGAERAGDPAARPGRRTCRPRSLN